MVSKKQFFVLLCIYVGYMLAGAGIFLHWEIPEEQARRKLEREERREIEELLNRHYIPSDEETQEGIFEKLTVYCGKPLSLNMTEIDTPLEWDYYTSVYFVITVVSTIGYGNLYPTIMESRVFMIFYSLIGIPINGIVLGIMGDFFAKTFEKLYKRWKNQEKKHDPTRIGLVMQVILYLIPGFIFFIFLPALIFMLFEGWDYEVSVYYAYVTLSTIGFGDYVAGMSDNGFAYQTFWVYRIFILFWIIIGLGYLVMVLGYISSALQSKKVRELEHLISYNLKRTPQKIREELRSLLNEVLLTRVKRVYKDERSPVSAPLTRTNSCPNLTMYRSEPSPATMRRRAFSTCPSGHELLRVQSDTDLERIDKDKTFNPAEAVVQPSELLVRVVNALGNYDQREEEEGIHCFSDSQILASEATRFGSDWTICNMPPSYQYTVRQRAASEVKFPFHEKLESNDLTWYGPAATKKLAELREKVLYKKSRRATLPVQPPSQPQSLLSRLMNTFRKTSKDETKMKDIDIERQDYMLKTSRGGPSNLEPPDRYLQQTGRGRLSTFSIQEDSVLETTSIAELLRALTAVADDDDASTHPPKRKLGTAGLTPPRYCSPPRTRRLPIRPNLRDRRSSLAVPTMQNETSSRRFSENTVRFVGACVECPTVLILTEYCPKGSLKDVLENEAIHLDWNFRMSLIHDVVKGMAYLHSCEVSVHGKLRSCNCLIDGRFVLKISDFGLTTLTTPLEVVKDANYYSKMLWVAPELLPLTVVPGSPATQKGDVYSFAIILEEIISREGPFSAARQYLDPQEIITRVAARENPPFRPAIGRGDCPEDLIELMERCWSDNPEDRPSFELIRGIIRCTMKGYCENLMDDLLRRMEQYASNLEALVGEKTEQLMQEKRRSEELLYQVLPRPVAQQLMAGELVQPEQFECVTIYFSDIVGFTSLCAKSTPMEVVDFLNDLYSTFDHIIGFYDVYKVETIGDAYMVVSGLPERNGNDHGKEIALMSLAILDAVKSFTIKHSPESQLKLRIGVHSGPVCAGVVGVRMPHYCLFGDAVNTASRMESTGQPLMIHVSEEAKQILDTFGTFKLELRGEVELKGKGFVTTYWLLGSSDPDPRPTTPPQSFAPPESQDANPYPLIFMGN